MDAEAFDVGEIVASAKSASDNEKWQCDGDDK